jgi:hypothetical protein
VSAARARIFPGYGSDLFGRDIGSPFSAWKHARCVDVGQLCRLVPPLVSRNWRRYVRSPSPRPLRRSPSAGHHHHQPRAAAGDIHPSLDRSLLRQTWFMMNVSENLNQIVMSGCGEEKRALHLIVPWICVLNLGTTMQVKYENLWNTTIAIKKIHKRQRFYPMVRPMLTPRCGDLLRSRVALNSSQVIQKSNLNTTLFFLISNPFVWKLHKL